MLRWLVSWTSSTFSGTSCMYATGDRDRQRQGERDRNRLLWGSICGNLSTWLLLPTCVYHNNNNLTTILMNVPSNCFALEAAPNVDVEQHLGPAQTGWPAALSRSSSWGTLLPVDRVALQYLHMNAAAHWWLHIYKAKIVLFYVTNIHFWNIVCVSCHLVLVEM